MVSASHVTIRKRVTLLLLFTVLVITVLIGRLTYLQLFKRSWLTENAVDQRVREIPVEAKRGMILDRNGKKLAVSVSSESIYAVPAEIQNAETTAAKLAAILNLSVEDLTAKLKKRQAFIWLRRKVTSEAAQAVQRLNLAGIGITQENKRVYPNETLACHVLGFTGIDSQGLDGVELALDSLLKGKQGSIIIEYDARGREIPLVTHRYAAPQPGQDAVLTIDLVIQQIVEREIEKAMVETQAKGISVIVMQPNTGEVLALANRPGYDPNHFADYAPKNWRNGAISNSYEPGSTFKIVTCAAALAEKAVTLSDRFFDSGSIEVQKRRIHCWKHGGHGSQTFAEVVQNSCNVGFVNIGLKLGIAGFYKNINSLGFGQETGIVLPGEAKGLIIPVEKAKLITIATMAIGQSIAVTPIQLITAVCAVVNDGKLLKPQVVKKIHNTQTGETTIYSPVIKKEVLTEKVTVPLKGILENVVEKGTGKNAYIEGCRIGGKTGTAQKVVGGNYSHDKYVASFVGFSPANQPKFVMLVVIDEPVGLYYGGQIAAPLFAAIAKDVISYVNIKGENLGE